VANRAYKVKNIGFDNIIMSSIIVGLNTYEWTTNALKLDISKKIMMISLNLKRSRLMILETKIKKLCLENMCMSCKIVLNLG